MLTTPTCSTGSSSMITKSGRRLLHRSLLPSTTPSRTTNAVPRLGRIRHPSTNPVSLQQFSFSSSSRRFNDSISAGGGRQRRWSSSSYSHSSSSPSSSSSSSHSSSSSTWSWMSFFSWFGWYSKKLDTHPITTKCISAGLISSLGNVLAQAIAHYQEQLEREEKDQMEFRQRQQPQQQQEEVSYKDGGYDGGAIDNNSRSSSIASQMTYQSSTPPKPFHVDLAQVGRFAFLNAAFVAPVLHHWYQFINRAVPGKSLSRVIQRVFWDEFVFSPVYIPVFLGMLWKLEGSSNEDVIKMTKSEVPAIIVAEWALWVPGMFATFRYVPVKFQVLVINVIGVVWQTFLAYMASHAKNNAKTAEEVNLVEQQALATTQHLLEGVGVVGVNPTEDEKPRTKFLSPVSHGIPAGIIVEEKVVPLVLNTIVRRETPRFYEFDVSDECDD